MFSGRKLTILYWCGFEHIMCLLNVPWLYWNAKGTLKENRKHLTLPHWFHTAHMKVKQSRNRPSVAQRVPGGLGSQISSHSAREGVEVVSLTHLPPLSPGVFLVLIFTSGWVDPRATERSEGDMSLKNPVTPPGIDPGTDRLVPQCLNHYATPGP